MQSAPEEYREQLGKCQEFHIVWSVVSLIVAFWKSAI